jgi:molecular chaperone GrpE
MKKHAEHEESAKKGHEEAAATAESPVAETLSDSGAKTAPSADDSAGTDAGANGANCAGEAAAGTDAGAKDSGANGEQKDATGEKPELKLAARIAELEKISADLQDQYLRKAADFDNYRKRMIREKQDAIDFANANLLGDLVQVLDDFDRAIAAGGTPEKGTPAAAMADGVTMIRNQLGSMLENKYGLAYYASKGQPFDPNLHEAVATTPSPDAKEATVAEEFTKGYKLKDRVIRHSKVMVHTPA